MARSNPNYRENWMETIEVGCTLLFVSVLGALFWPSRAPSYFRLSQDQMDGAVATYNDL